MRTETMGKDTPVSTEQQLTKRQTRLYAVVLTTSLIAGLLLYGRGLSARDLLLQGLSLTIPVVSVVWGMAFFHKEPRFETIQIWVLALIHIRDANHI